MISGNLGLIDFRHFRVYAVLALLLFGVSTNIFAKEKRVVRTTVFSEVSPNYQREVLPSGKFKPETYAFVQGHKIHKGRPDESLNALTYNDIVGILAEPLYMEQYLPSTDPTQTDILLRVVWGKTVPGDDGGMGQLAIDGMTDILNEIDALDDLDGTDTGFGGTRIEGEGEFAQMMMMQQLADEARDRANRHNSLLLGYAKELSDLNTTLGRQGPLRHVRRQMIDEIETPRYFVILEAYDFQKILRKETRELLWVTRFSIRAKGRNFDEELLTMAKAASRSFGQNNGKLIRNARPGRVEFGELEFLEDVEEK